MAIFHESMKDKLFFVYMFFFKFVSFHLILNEFCGINTFDMES